MDKKKQQLGMNPSTANHRLVKDILWELIKQTGQDFCCKCGEPMSRETFSIEHIVPWLDSENPVALFFDVKNISFSHLSCNIADRRQLKFARCGTDSKYSSGCRCVDCTKAHAVKRKEEYCPNKRRDKYLNKGY